MKLTDAQRLDLVEEKQLRPKCVEWQQWEIVVGYDRESRAVVVHGASVREAIDAVAEFWTITKTEYVRGTIPVQEEAFGDYSNGRYAWFLRNAVKLSRMIECRGMLGLWAIPPDVEVQIPRHLIGP